MNRRHKNFRIDVCGDAFEALLEADQFAIARFDASDAFELSGIGSTSMTAE